MRFRFPASTAMFAAMLVWACKPAPRPVELSAQATGTPPAGPAPQKVEEPEGVWAVRDEAGQPFDLVLFPGGQAVSTRVKGPGGARGERGFWHHEGGSVWVLLNGGWRHEIAGVHDGFEHRAFAAGTPAGSPSHQSEAVRFRGPEARFTGAWRLNREPDGSHLYIVLQSSGSAFSTVSGLTAGRWEVVDDAARCTWPDGWVDQLSLVDGIWQKKSWVGGDEMTPADLSEATRVGDGAFEIQP